MNRFSFLEQDYPELYRVCSEAMEYGLQDFSIAMLKSRQALEKIVEHFDAEGENLFGKINALGDSGEIPKSVMKHFHTVRQVANPSVHGQEVSEAEILDALDALFEITVWLAVRKEGHRYEPELFNDRDRFIVRRYETQMGNEDRTVSGGTPTGRTQAIDFEKILEQYKRAAEAGDSDAMFRVGEMYAIGKGIAQDYDEAMQWYQKAADEGNTAAMIAMGKLCAEGKGVQQNFGEAMKWYQKAADMDNQGAATLLGECYEKGEGVAQDYAEAMRRYQAAAEKGNTVAMRNMSRLYAWGNGTVMDEKEALQWLQKAANKGDTEAMKRLADKHLWGEWGLPKNEEKALDLLRKADDAGDTEATIKIGSLYAYGEYEEYLRGLKIKGRHWKPFLVPQNKDEAVRWFEKAANAGDSNGLCHLGNYYTYFFDFMGWYDYYSCRKTTKVDKFKFKYLFHWDVSSLPHWDPTLGIKYYLKAAALGNSEAIGRLGVNYLSGEIVDKDVAEGLKCIHQSVELGNTNAMLFLGWLYGNGAEVPQDKIAEFRWDRKAAERKNTVAMLLMGLKYWAGDGVAQDYGEAMKWLRKSADAENGEGMYYIGVMYCNGNGVKQDHREAMKWFQKAADKQSDSAMYEIGNLYAYGEGVPCNKEKAKEWYQKAADLGNEEALKKLKKGFCFITTAVCGSLQKPDDCYELTSFRAFRDGWLSAQPDGAALIDEYYAVAPPIVRAIDALPDAKEIYRGIWDKYLAPCLAMLEAKNMRGCKEMYIKMVRDLQRRFG